MTTINSIANLLVTSCGLSEVEAFEAVSNYTEADYIAEKEEEAYWAEVEAREEAEREEEAREWRALNDFFNKYIAGKSYDEMDWDAWGYYSDWYKDVNGIRPRWYIEALYEEKMRAERNEVRDDLENDGWIMLTDRDGWYTYERQISPSMMSIWRWDNCGRTFEAMERAQARTQEEA